MEFVLAVAGLFEQRFEFFPDPVTIMFVPASATIMGLVGAAIGTAVNRGGFPTGPSLEGAFFGAGLSFLYLIVGLNV